MDLDSVIKELGQFGKYQSIIYFLLFFPFIHHSICSLSFVFTVSDIKYRQVIEKYHEKKRELHMAFIDLEQAYDNVPRENTWKALEHVYTYKYKCHIAECEENSTIYHTPWLTSAIPHNANKEIIDECRRYKFVSRFNHDNCTEEGLFSFNETEKCDNYIFESTEISITREFNLLCNENNWKRAAVGTLNNVAQFFGLPISGIVSDRYGRKLTTVVGVVLSSLLGTLKSFSSSYLEFVIFEMLDAMASAGVYCSIFILGMEVIGPDMRGFCGGLLAIYYPIGTTILGVVAWLVDDWRKCLRILYMPGFIFISYFWLLPESFRWLIANGKRKEAVKIINEVAKTNGKAMSDNVKKYLETLENDKIHCEEKKLAFSMKEICSSRITVLRVLNGSVSWIIHTFVFYGLSLNSVSIAGNKYLNFIFVSLIELPAYVIAWYTIDTIGRKMSIFISLILCGITCTAFALVETGVIRTNVCYLLLIMLIIIINVLWSMLLLHRYGYTLKLILFLGGKFGITISFTAFYILVSEMYPTYLRNSLLGFCSTMGRFGSMVAPQTALLGLYVDPVLVFGFSSFLGAFLALYFPETLNQKLPETLEESENIGKTMSYQGTPASKANSAVEPIVKENVPPSESETIIKGPIGDSESTRLDLAKKGDSDMDSQGLNSEDSLEVSNTSAETYMKGCYVEYYWPG